MIFDTSPFHLCLAWKNRIGLNIFSTCSGKAVAENEKTRTSPEEFEEAPGRRQALRERLKVFAWKKCRVKRVSERSERSESA